MKDDKYDSEVDGAAKMEQVAAAQSNSLASFWTSVMQADEPPKIIMTASDYKLKGLAAKLDNFFRITERGSDFVTEAIGGMTTFFAMCYIMALNGIIIAGYFNTGIPVKGTFFATTLTAGVFTFLMGAFVNVPVALAPGMGLNGVFGKYAGNVCWSTLGKADPGPGATDRQLMDAYNQIMKNGGCPGWGVDSLPWTDAMGAVFISGWIYLFLTVTGFRQVLFKAVPKSLRASITVGIGFFITIIGLKIGKITRVTPAPWSVPSVVQQAQCFYVNANITGFSPVPAPDFCNNGVDLDMATYDLGFVNLTQHPEARIAVLGLALVAIFTTMGIRGAIILAITLATLIGINYANNNGVYFDDHTGKNGMVDGHLHPVTPARWTSGKYAVFPTGDPRDGYVTPPQYPVTAVTNLANWFAYDKLQFHSGLSDSQKRWVSDHFFLPDMSVIPSGMLTFKYAKKPLFWEAVFTFLYVEMFDSFGTLTGIMTRAGLLKGDQEKAMTKVNRAMLVDGCSLWMGGLIGANSCTCYIESNTGIEAGARTGFASIVTGSAFLLSLIFVFPFVAIIPDAATTCALVMVGVYSLDACRDINMGDIIDQLTAFFCIATMGFTYSIANGIFVAFIFYALMKWTRWAYQKVLLKVRPSAAYDEEQVDCKLPHPLLTVMAAAFAVRFEFLSPGHQ